MGIFDDDIVKDILRRVVESAQRQGGFDEAMSEQIERQVRADWGGCEPYIAHGRAEQLAERDEKIARAYWDQGNRDMRQLSVRFGLSIKQLRRIVFK